MSDTNTQLPVEVEYNIRHINNYNSELKVINEMVAKGYKLIAVSPYSSGNSLYFERVKPLTAYATKLHELQQENEQLRQWKIEAVEQLMPIGSYAHKHLEVNLGDSCTVLVIAELDRLREENATLKAQPGIGWVKASEFKYEVGMPYHAKDSKSRGAGSFDDFGNFFWGDGSFTAGENQDDLLILDESASPAAPTGCWVNGQYDKLYDQVKGGKRTVCWVDYSYFGSAEVYRVICTCRPETLEFTSMGHSYGRAFEGEINFIELCKMLNVEWLNESPAAGREEDAADVTAAMEWVKTSNWGFVRGIGWQQYGEPNPSKYISTAQLYTIFKQQKDK